MNHFKLLFGPGGGTGLQLFKLKCPSLSMNDFGDEAKTYCYFHHLTLSTQNSFQFGTFRSVWYYFISKQLLKYIQLYETVELLNSLKCLLGYLHYTPLGCSPSPDPMWTRDALCTGMSLSWVVFYYKNPKSCNQLLTYTVQRFILMCSVFLWKYIAVAFVWQVSGYLVFYYLLFSFLRKPWRSVAMIWMLPLRDCMDFMLDMQKEI